MLRVRLCLSMTKSSARGGIGTRLESTRSDDAFAGVRDAFARSRSGPDPDLAAVPCLPVVILDGAGRLGGAEARIDRLAQHRVQRLRSVWGSPTGEAFASKDTSAHDSITCRESRMYGRNRQSPVTRPLASKASRADGPGAAGVAGQGDGHPTWRPRSGLGLFACGDAEKLVYCTRAVFDRRSFSPPSWPMSCT